MKPAIYKFTVSENVKLLALPVVHALTISSEGQPSGVFKADVVTQIIEANFDALPLHELPEVGSLYDAERMLQYRARWEHVFRGYDEKFQEDVVAAVNATFARKHPRFSRYREFESVTVEGQLQRLFYRFDELPKGILAEVIEAKTAEIEIDIAKRDDLLAIYTEMRRKPKRYHTVGDVLIDGGTSRANLRVVA